MSTATLIVLGRDLKPDLVTEKLGMRPDRSWKRGERKSNALKNSAGPPLDSRHGRGGWKAFLKGATRKHGLSTQVQLWCARLMAKRSAVKILQKLGYSLSIDCQTEPPDFIQFEAELLRQLADLKVRLDISIYKGRTALNSQSDEGRS